MQPTAADIVAMGFVFQMFGYSTEEDLNTLLTELIAEHGVILSGRIGATAYGTSDQPTSTYVKRSLKCSVAADLCQMRINRIAQDIKQEDGSDAKKMRQQRQDYLNESELWIGKIEVSAGSGNDFAVGTVVTSHFAETS